MTPSILDFLRRHLQQKALGNVLEVGSKNFNGSAKEVLYEQATNWLGIDLESGKDVDLVINDISEITYLGMFDTIVCCECLEHDPNPWKTLTQINNVLNDNGLLVVTTPTFGFPEHRYPIDCYRFGMDAYREFIFKGYNNVVLETVEDKFGYPIICGLGYKP